MGTRDGERWTESDGTVHTVNSTQDPSAPDGHYHSQSSADGSIHATAVYSADGTMPDVKANCAWEPRPRQRQRGKKRETGIMTH
jgi:hypothetical protein